jgi:hypothetical protein
MCMGDFVPTKMVVKDYFKKHDVQKKIPWKHDGPLNFIKQFANLVCEKCFV